jgi:hypothetical protein
VTSDTTKEIDDEQQEEARPPRGMKKRRIAAIVCGRATPEAYARIWGKSRRIRRRVNIHSVNIH